MQEFTTKPNGFEEIRKKLIVRMSAIFGFILIAVFAFQMMSSNKNDEGTPSTWPYVFGFLVLVMIFSLVRGVKRQKATFESYSLKITEDSITREVLNVPTIVLKKRDVREIIKSQQGDFCIVGDNKISAILIPAQINNSKELERILQEIKPIQVRISKSWAEYLQIPIVFLGIGSMFLCLLASNKIVVGVSGLSFIVLMIYSFIVIQMSKNVEKRTKRLSFILFFPLITVISVLIKKLIS
jgi:uncharacterized membrane protein (DUF485 family)